MDTSHSSAAFEPRHTSEEPRLDPHSRKEARKRTAVGAHIVHSAVLREGEAELRRTTSALAWSALAAGLSMGFSLATEGFLRHHLPDTVWRPLIANLGYAAGFLLVVVGRQQLYTENTLTAVLPVLNRKSLAALANMLRLWGVVLALNLVGAAIFAWYFAKTGVLEPAVRATFAEIGREASRHDGFTTFLRAIPAGWLIALMVWLGPAIPTARHWMVLLLAYIVGIADLSHVIAGSVEVMFFVMSGGLGWGEYAARYLLPTLVGNTIGGVVLVALLNHAQVVAGGGNNHERPAGGHQDKAGGRPRDAAAGEPAIRYS